jgi:peptidoglycan/LPS O-acetylase OafA/YrhL
MRIGEMSAPVGVAGTRSRTLDALRGGAVLLVLGRHVPVEGTGRFVDLARHVGWIGVDLFFVLSGFLISGLLFVEYQARGELRLRRFFVRRGLKIYPAFYALLAYTIAMRLYLGRELSPSAVFSEGLFFANYGPALWAHTWSLDVEEHFYILLGIAIWWLARRGGSDPFRPLVPALLIIAVCALSARFVTARLLPYDDKTHLFPTHLRIDSLGFGVLLGYLFHFHRGRLVSFVGGHRLAILLVSGVFIAPAFVLSLARDQAMVTFGLTGLYLGFGGLLVCAVVGTREPVRLLGWAGAAVAAIGVYSYSIYLWHIPTAGLAHRIALKLFGISGGPDWVRVLLYVSGSIAVGTVMARIIELPVLKLRDQWLPTPRALQPVVLQSIAIEKSVEAPPGSGGLAGPRQGRS